MNHLNSLRDYEFFKNAPTPPSLPGSLCVRDKDA